MQINTIFIHTKNAAHCEEWVLLKRKTNFQESETNFLQLFLSSVSEINKMPILQMVAVFKLKNISGRSFQYNVFQSTNTYYVRIK